MDEIRVEESWLLVPMAMVLCWKTGDYSIWVGREFLSQAKKFKYLRVLFTSGVKMERDMDRQIGVR